MVREPVELIHAQVQALRECGVHRFGVNLILAATDPELLEAQVAACVALGVPVVGLFWDLSAPLVQRLRAIADEAETLLTAGTPPPEPVQAASPACFAQEADDRYMGYAAGRNCWRP
jgi:hypothetical protein